MDILPKELKYFRSPDRSVHSKKQTPEDEMIELRGLNKTMNWGELDRWNYTNPDLATPPPYTVYTFLTLGEAFRVFLIIMGAHMLAMLLVKIATSSQFRIRKHPLRKLIHVIQNLSLATPYQDWDEMEDEEVRTIPEYKTRFRRTNIEMACCLTLNIVVSLVMLVPLFYTGMPFIKRFHTQYMTFVHISPNSHNSHFPRLQSA